MTALDRVILLDPGRHAVAVRHVPHSLAVFDTHFPRFPVLPGVLILADLTEVARTALAPQADEVWTLVGASRVRFRRFVAPGDAVELTAELTERRNSRASFRCRARVGATVVTTVGNLTLERQPRTPVGAS